MNVLTLDFKVRVLVCENRFRWGDSFVDLFGVVWVIRLGMFRLFVRGWLLGRLVAFGTVGFGELGIGRMGCGRIWLGFEHGEEIERLKTFEDNFAIIKFESSF